MALQGLRSDLAARVCNVSASHGVSSNQVPELDPFYDPFCKVLGTCFCCLALSIVLLTLNQVFKRKRWTRSYSIHILNAISIGCFGIFLLFGGGVHAPEDSLLRDVQISFYCLSWIVFKVMVMRWIQGQRQLLVPFEEFKHSSSCRSTLILLLPPLPSTIGFGFVLILARSPGYTCLPFVSLCRRWYGFAGVSTAMVTGAGFVYLRQTARIVSW